MRKLYFIVCLISCQVCQPLLGQHLNMGKQRLASHPVFDYNPKSSFVDFYEKVPPGDTIFRLFIHYDGYEDHLLSCLKSPVFRYVQELSISGHFDEVPPAIAHLKQLKALFIHNHQDGGCEGDCPLYIPNEIYHLPELEVLSLSTHNISINDSIINLKKLKHIYLSPASLLPCLFTGMPQLRSILLNVYIPTETQYLKVCGKLLTFNITTYSNANSWHDDEAHDDTSSAIISSKNQLLSEKIDITLKDSYDKKRVTFSLKGEIKNNEATGTWAINCGYSLQANYSNGRSDVIKVMNDTIPMATITKNNQGEEFQEFRNVKKHFKNGIPYGSWEYYQYNGTCYQQIVYDDPEHPNPVNAITSGYFIRKTYINGKASGRWTESTGDHIKITEFENGNPIKITDQKRTHAVPNMIKEFKYDQTISSIDTYYPNAFHQSYLYSKESYNYYIPDGEFMSYHPNGTLHEKKVYNNGKIIGDIIGNHENGKTAYIKSYEQGRIKHEKRFYQNGVMAQEVHYNAKGKHGTENTWTEKAKLKESTYYENGLPFGLSQKFDDGGKVISEKYYEQGLKVYDEEQGFDYVFVNSEKNKLFNFFYLFKMEQPFRNKNCTMQKKELNDSTFMITEYQYTENRGRHLKYIKEFSFKNYKLSGTQILKDSAGNIIQYVHCNAGLKEGKFTLVHLEDSLSLNYTRNCVIDTVLTYYFKRGRQTEIHYYKNKQLYRAEQFYFSHIGKSIENITVEYVKEKQPKPADKYNTPVDEPLALIMNVPKHPNSMFFIPETLTHCIDGKKTSTIKFHASVTEADCMSIRRVKGYAVADGKKERFSKEDMSTYESCFIRYSVFNIFFNGIITCYH